MAFATNELFAEADGLGSGPSVFPTVIQPKTFKLGSGTLARMCPLQFEDASGQWIAWPGGGTSEQTVVTAASTTATDGTFDLIIEIDGVPTSVTFVHDDDAAACKAAILAQTDLVTADLTTADGSGGLSTNDGTMTITWAGAMAEQDLVVTADMTGLVGNDHVLSEGVAGVTLDRIDGFVWPDAVVLDSDEEVLGQVMLGGRIHADALVASPDAPLYAVKAMCRFKQPRDSGFIFEGLTDFH